MPHIPSRQLHFHFSNPGETAQIGAGAASSICLWPQGIRLEGANFRLKTQLGRARFESFPTFVWILVPHVQEAIWRGNVRVVARGKEVSIRDLAVFDNYVWGL